MLNRTLPLFSFSLLFIGLALSAFAIHVTSNAHGAIAALRSAEISQVIEVYKEHSSGRKDVAIETYRAKCAVRLLSNTELERLHPGNTGNITFSISKEEYEHPERLIGKHSWVSISSTGEYSQSVGIAIGGGAFLLFGSLAQIIAVSWSKLFARIRSRRFRIFAYASHAFYVASFIGSIFIVGDPRFADKERLLYANAFYGVVSVLLTLTILLSMYLLIFRRPPTQDVSETP